MSSFFHLPRFFRLLKQDGAMLHRSFLLLILSSVAIYVGIWLLLVLLLDMAIPPAPRYFISSAIITLSIYLAPYQLYKKKRHGHLADSALVWHIFHQCPDKVFNQRTEGIYYGIVPASAFEKLLSMLSWCSLFFILAEVLAIYTTDQLLTFIPLESGYQGSLWPQLFQSNTEKLAPVMMAEPALSEMNFKMVPHFIVGYIFNQSVFVYLNMLLRSHKISGSILILICAGIVVSIASAILMVSYVSGLDASGLNADPENIVGILQTTFNRSIIFFYLIPLVFWALTYFRIKRIQY